MLQRAVTSLLLLYIYCYMQGETTEHIVAVYEHAHISGKPTNRKEALKIMRENAEIYSHQIRLAKSKGAELITFPEYGLTGNIAGDTRQSVYPYAEKIPELDSNEACMKCDSCTLTAGSETVNHMACLARYFRIYVVVNLLEKVECLGLNRCPHGDSLLIYNTNVIFDPQGCIVAKYHKYYMWASEGRMLDKPEAPEYAYIDTPLGRLGTIICFDGVFEEPSVTLVTKYKVDTILFPTLWTMLNGSTRLYQNIIEYSSGWAQRQNVNFLAANIRNHDLNCYGSAIATPEGIANVYYEPENKAGKLLLAKIQSKNRKSKEMPHVVDACTSFRKLEEHIEVKAREGRHYHVIPLTKPSGTVEVCHQKLCCKVEYEGKRGPDQMVLAAYSWSFLTQMPKKDPALPFSVEVCLLQTCKNDSLESCLEFPISQSSIKFDKVVLSGYFVSEYVYPMVVGSGYQVTGFDWTYSYAGRYNQIEMSGVDVPIQNAALQTFYNENDTSACYCEN